LTKLGDGKIDKGIQTPPCDNVGWCVMSKKKYIISENSKKPF